MPLTPATEREGIRARRFAGLVLAIWFVVTALLALVEINDPDLGFHIAWGRLLQEHFGAARTETWGQAPAVTRYAYSYWLYQVAVSWMYDHLGPASLVIGRALTVLAVAGLGIALARRLGATWTGCALGLVLFTLVSHERFVDRPDLLSHLFWMIALWILLRARARLWPLVALQVIWANTHVYFGLLPLLALFTLGAGWIESRREQRDADRSGPKRIALVLLLLVMAASITPSGPGSWLTQLSIARFLTGDAPIPIPIQEMLSPYAVSDRSIALWSFRIVMPLLIVGAVLARRAIGLPLLAALVLAALLGGTARRAMSIFGCTALVAAPLIVDAGLAWIRSRRTRTAGDAAVDARMRDAASDTRASTWSDARTNDVKSNVRPTGTPSAGARASGVIAALLLFVAFVSGVVGGVGLLNGRIFLAQDKNLRVGSFGPPNYNVRSAAAFLRSSQVEGPLLHAPVHAGPLLLENGSRLTPFLDARWLGTPDKIDLFLRLRQADDRSIAPLWMEACNTHQFQAVLLDFYEMPALLRRVWVDPDWAPVFIDEGGAVFVARRGPNRSLARTLERGVRAAVLDAPADVQERLAEATRRFLASPRPAFWEPLRFPWESFYRANFGLQVREPRIAQAAYLELLTQENGSLWESPHRLNVMSNLLWCLPPEETEAGIELLGALRAEPTMAEQNRRALLLQEIVARALRSDADGAQALAEQVSGDPDFSAQERQWAWAQVATGREQSQEWEGLLAALKRADQELPDSPQVWRSIGLVLDLRLERWNEAAAAYRKFLDLGGADSLVSQRLRILESPDGARGATPHDHDEHETHEHETHEHETHD